MSLRVLVLCTANSARSQMAEGLLRHIAGELMEVASAGTNPSKVNTYAIRAMRERGIDISRHQSEHLNRYLDQAFDYVITVCDQAAETCPVFPGKAERIHWGFPDPAATTGDDEDILRAFRETRDAIEKQLRSWVAELRIRS